MHDTRLGVAQGRRMKRAVRPLDRIESSTIYGFPIRLILGFGVLDLASGDQGAD
jgi:hypothetical protein